MSQVEAFYDADPQYEWGRHDRHRTEFAVTLRALEDYLPPVPAKIADIGGGPGWYAIQLTQRGYAVSLLDLSSGNIALARRQAEQAGVTLADCQTGNALHLTMYADGVFDAALLMGPLYHLITEEDRRQAVQEALRVLRSDGMIFAAFITRFAPLREDAVRSGFFDNNLELFKQLWSSGINDPETGFTDASFAHPAEVIPFMESCGLHTELMLGVEGLVSRNEARINELRGKAFDNWTEINYLVGRDPTLWGASDHLLYIGRKPSA